MVIPFNKLSGGLVDVRGKFNLSDTAYFSDLRNFSGSIDESIERRPPLKRTNLYNTEQFNNLHEEDFNRVHQGIIDLKVHSGNLLVWRDFDLGDTEDNNFGSMDLIAGLGLHDDDQLDILSLAYWTSGQQWRLQRGVSGYQRRERDARNNPLPLPTLTKDEDGYIVDERFLDIEKRKLLNIFSSRGFINQMDWVSRDIPYDATFDTDDPLTDKYFVLQTRNKIRVLDILDLETRMIKKRYFFCVAKNRLARSFPSSYFYWPKYGGQAFVVLSWTPGNIVDHGRYKLEHYAVDPDTYLNDNIPDVLGSDQIVAHPQYPRIDLANKPVRSNNQFFSNNKYLGAAGFCLNTYIFGGKYATETIHPFTNLEESDMFSEELETFGKGAYVNFGGCLMFVDEDRLEAGDINDSRKYRSEDIIPEDLPIKCLIMEPVAGNTTLDGRIDLVTGNRFSTTGALLPMSILQTTAVKNSNYMTYTFDTSVSGLNAQYQNLQTSKFRLGSGAINIVQSVNDYLERDRTETADIFNEDRMTWRSLTDLKYGRDGLREAIESLTPTITMIPDICNNHRLLTGGQTAAQYDQQWNISSPDFDYFNLDSFSMNGQVSLFLDVKNKSQFGAGVGQCEYVGDTDWIAFDSCGGLPELISEIFPAVTSDYEDLSSPPSETPWRFTGMFNPYINPEAYSSQQVLNETLIRSNTNLPLGGFASLGGLGVTLVKFKRDLFEGRTTRFRITQDKSSYAGGFSETLYNNGWSELFKNVEKLAFVYVDWEDESIRNFFLNRDLISLPMLSESGFGEVVLSQLHSENVSEGGTTVENAYERYIRKAYYAVAGEAVLQALSLANGREIARETILQNWSVAKLPFPLGLDVEEGGAGNRYQIIKDTVQFHKTDDWLQNALGDPRGAEGHGLGGNPFWYRMRADIATYSNKSYGATQLTAVTYIERNNRGNQLLSDGGDLKEAVTPGLVTEKTINNTIVADDIRSKPPAFWGVNWYNALYCGLKDSLTCFNPKELLPFKTTPKFVGAEGLRAVSVDGNVLNLSDLRLHINEDLWFSNPLREFLLTTPQYVAEANRLKDLRVTARDLPFVFGRNGVERITDSPGWFSQHEIKSGRNSSGSRITGITQAFLDERGAVYLSSNNLTFRANNLLGEDFVQVDVLSNTDSSQGLFEYDGRAFLALGSVNFNTIRYVEEARTYTSEPANRLYSRVPRVTSLLDFYSAKRLLICPTEDESEMLVISMGERRNIKSYSTFKFANRIKKSVKMSENEILTIDEDGVVASMDFSRSINNNDWEDHNANADTKPSFRMLPIQFADSKGSTFDYLFNISGASIGYEGNLEGLLRVTEAANNFEKVVQSINKTNTPNRRGIASYKSFTSPARVQFPEFGYLHSGSGYVKIESLMLRLGGSR